MGTYLVIWAQYKLVRADSHHQNGWLPDALFTSQLILDSVLLPKASEHSLCWLFCKADAGMIGDKNSVRRVNPRSIFPYSVSQGFSYIWNPQDFYWWNWKQVLGPEEESFPHSERGDCLQSGGIPLVSRNLPTNTLSFPFTSFLHGSFFSLFITFTWCWQLVLCVSQTD